MPTKARTCYVHIGQSCRHCPHCQQEFTNWRKHLQACPEWAYTRYRIRHTGHKVMTDFDMRLSGRTRQGGLDS